MNLEWKNSLNINSRSYICGYCSNPLASNVGYIQKDLNSGHTFASIYICHSCGGPTYFNASNKQYPGIAYGNDIKNISPQDVKKLYDEARNCIACNAFTASVLCSRKLLMNIAVSKGANLGLKFIQYVEYLSEKGYIPPDGKEWVDHIRNKGNEATHEISIMTEEEAKELIDFLEMLLKFIYEFPARVKNKLN